MTVPDKSGTTVSTKGQVILPKAIRNWLNWKPGTRLDVEATPDGTVVLKRAPLFEPKTLDEAFGMLKYDGPPKTLEEMDEGITAEVRRRHARGRY